MNTKKMLAILAALSMLGTTDKMTFFTSEYENRRDSE